LDILDGYRFFLRYFCFLGLGAHIEYLSHASLGHPREMCPKKVELRKWPGLQLLPDLRWRMLASFVPRKMENL